MARTILFNTDTSYEHRQNESLTRNIAHGPMLSPSGMWKIKMQCF